MRTTNCESLMFQVTEEALCTWRLANLLPSGKQKKPNMPKTTRPHELAIHQWSPNLTNLQTPTKICFLRFELLELLVGHLMCFFFFPGYWWQRCPFVSVLQVAWTYWPCHCSAVRPCWWPPRTRPCHLSGCGAFREAMGGPKMGWFRRENPIVRNGWWLGKPLRLRKPPCAKSEKPAIHGDLMNIYEMQNSHKRFSDYGGYQRVLSTVKSMEHRRI